MKTNYSLSPLNLSFEKLKTSHIKNNDGSITPRTTTNKTILDKIEIEPGILELYEKSMFKKADETILQLDKELEQKAKKIEPLEKLASIDKLYSKDLEKTILEVNSIRTKVISIKDSVSIQIKDNCCAPGILVHPCARREVHFILTFLLHFVILHFKFRYKVFSIRIPF